MEQKIKNEILNAKMNNIKAYFINNKKKLLLIPVALISAALLTQFKNINEEQVQAAKALEQAETNIYFNNFSTKNMNTIIELIKEDEPNFQLYQLAKEAFNKDKPEATDITTFIEITKLFSGNDFSKQHLNDSKKVNSGLIILDQYISALGIYMFENQFKLTQEQKEECNTMMDSLVEFKNTGLQQLDSFELKTNNTQRM